MRLTSGNNWQHVKTFIDGAAIAYANTIAGLTGSTLLAEQ
jgi:hypothetical protein